MKRIIRLTESDLTRIVKRVISEQENQKEIFRGDSDIETLMTETAKELGKLTDDANMYYNKYQKTMAGRAHIGNVTKWGTPEFWMKNVRVWNNLSEQHPMCEDILNVNANLDWSIYDYHCGQDNFMKTGYGVLIGNMDARAGAINVPIFYVYDPQSKVHKLATENGHEIFNENLGVDLRNILHPFFMKIDEIICRKPSTGGDNRWAQTNKPSNTDMA